MITTLAHTVLVDDVENVIVSAAAVDPATGNFMREIRVIGKDSNNVEVVTYSLWLSASAAEKINVTAPEHDF